MKLTYDLNYLYEDEFGSDETKGLPLNEKVEMLRKHIFNFEYPVDEEYRKELETKFLYKFWFKELAFGTYTYWHYKLQALLMEHGLRYNQMFTAYVGDIKEAINMFDVESTTNMKSTTSLDVEGQAILDGETETFSVNKSLDTPQGHSVIDDNNLSGLANSKNIGTNKGNNTETTKQRGSNDGDTVSKQKGYSGVPLFQLYRMYNEQVLYATDFFIADARSLFLEIVI